jgi:hypothetical protein
MEPFVLVDFMIYKFSIVQISIQENFVFSILRKKRLFDDFGNEVLLAESSNNYRCILEPNEDIDGELAKIFADGAEINLELINFIHNELKSTLKIWWTAERIEAYRKSISNTDD